jgi:hypothetical protein
MLLASVTCRSSKANGSGAQGLEKIKGWLGRKMNFFSGQQGRYIFYNGSQGILSFFLCACDWSPS